MSGSPSDEPVDELLAAAYALDGPDANRALYARWAATYESGFIVDSGYQYHEQVARAFVGIDADAPDGAILDVGCGTGLAGLALQRLRPSIIDGLDISPEMLGEAAAKQHDGRPVYRDLVEADLTRPLAFADGTYAAVLSVGTFTHGHVGPSALHEVVRVVRPGGHLAIGINAAHFESAGFASVIDHLAVASRVRHVRFVEAPIYATSDAVDPDQVARILTCIVE